MTVANDSVMLYESYTFNFKWFIQNHKCITNLRILKLGRCDVLLGVNWLRNYSPILFNFIKIKISFKKEK